MKNIGITKDYTEVVKIPSTQNKFQLNPIPAQSTLNVSNLTEKTSISIYNMQGQMLIVEKVNVNGNMSFDISSLPAGTYLASIISGNPKQQQIMFIKE